MKRQKSSHYKIVNGEWVEKRSFDTESETIETACFYNAKQNLPYKRQYTIFNLLLIFFVTEQLFG